MNGILNWKAFDYKFCGNPQAAFETLAYHMFCRKYHITEGLPAFYNQKHIETDPYTCDDGTVVGFQAKYYSTPSITAAQKSELIKAIEGAAATYDGLNMLCFYLSRPFSQSSAKGETKTEMQKEIKSKADELGITIEWIVPSNFEKILNDPVNADLREYFFSVEPSGETPRVLPKILTNSLPTGPEIGLVGRDEIVDELRAMLDAEKCVALVRGLGGIGKTAVMQKVCDKKLTDGDDRNHVAWITCGDSLEDDFLVLCDAFGIPKNIGKEESFNAVLRAMKGIEGKLYLFLDDLSRDSANKDLETLNALRPNVHVMITSRRQIKGIPHLELRELNDGSAIDMFYGYYERDKERKYLEDAKGIIDSESVKRHTLLVELLAKAANRSFDTLDVFRGELEKKGFFEVSKAKLDGAHDENLTIEESVTRLYGISELTPEQRRIMSLFSIFTPEKVIYGKVVEWAGFDENDVEDLVQLGWLVRTEGGYVIHQIVKDSIARQVAGSLKIEEYGELIEKVADTDSYLSVMLGYTKVRERIVLAEDVARSVDRRIKEMLEIGVWSKQDKTFLRSISVLLNNMAGVYQEQGDYEKALEYYDKALKVRERVFGSDHPSTATTYNNMAVVYKEQGDYEKALEYYDKALKVRERVFGSDHPSTATTYNNMAVVYQYQGEYEKALEYYDKALEVSERVLGSDHPSTATTYNNMAGVYHYQGEYEKALEYYGKALEVVEKILGSDHPSTATTYNNMAGVYQYQGEYEKALEYYGKALDVRERVLGSGHPDTATTYNNMALVYQYQGEYEKALEYYDKALEVSERVLGSDHPSTATTYNNMALVYKEQGEYEKALEYYGKALEIVERALGNDHPSTATTYNNMAGVYKAKGDYEKALEYYGKALDVRERTLGNDHPDTATTYNNMAGVYQYQGEYEKALEYYGKALDVRERTLGNDHPSTATTYNNMAGVYENQGDYEKALKYYGKALDVKERTLGNDHPSTATTYNNMAGVYQEQGDYEKALEYYEKDLEISERTLGNDHPSTATTYNNMAGVYEDQGDYKKALEYYDKALKVREKVLGSGHPSTATTYNNMAGMYQDQGDYDKALEYYDKALEVRERVLGSGHPDTATTYHNMAGVYQAQGDYEKALEYYGKALEIRERSLGNGHPDTATTYYNMAGVYLACGDYEKALEYLEKALTVFMAKLGVNHPYTQRTQRNVQYLKSLIKLD